MARATELRGIVKKRFYPFAESRGFVRAKSRNSLYVTFRRARPDVIHVFDIQWEKYGSASFVVNFGECPVTGVDMIDIGHVDAADVLPGYCSRGGRLQRERGPFGWFRLRKSWREVLVSFEWHYRPEDVVQQAMDWFPEVETWWAHKHAGPHIYNPR
jgi:uncharacterized protein DUF4304